MTLMIRISCCGYPIPAYIRLYVSFYLLSRFLEVQSPMTDMSQKFVTYQVAGYMTTQIVSGFCNPFPLRKKGFADYGTVLRSS